MSSAIAAPPSNPNPTTDLSGVTQNWDKVLPASQRFVVLPAFSNAAVLDKETGLVWEKSPDAVNCHGVLVQPKMPAHRRLSEVGKAGACQLLMNWQAW